MIKVAVYHATREIFRDSIFFDHIDTKFFGPDNVRESLKNPDHYQKAGTLVYPDNVDVQQAASYTFRDTQNLDEHWNKEEPCRSSCVGDVFVITDNDYKITRLVVDRFGFHTLDEDI